MPSSGVQTCALRSEEHTSELQSHDNLVCRLLLEKHRECRGGGPYRAREPSVAQHRHRTRAEPRGEANSAPGCGGRASSCSMPLASFFFNDTATTEISTLSLHDALPILHAIAGEDLDLAVVHLHGTRHHDLQMEDRKSTRLNSSHTIISYAVFCLKQ